MIRRKSVPKRPRIYDLNEDGDIEPIGFVSTQPINKFIPLIDLTKPQANDLNNDVNRDLNHGNLPGSVIDRDNYNLITNTIDTQTIPCRYLEFGNIRVHFETPSSSPSSNHPFNDNNTDSNNEFCLGEQEKNISPTSHQNETISLPENYLQDEQDVNQLGYSSPINISNMETCLQYYSDLFMENSLFASPTLPSDSEPQIPTDIDLTSSYPPCSSSFSWPSPPPPLSSPSPRPKSRKSKRRKKSKSPDIILIRSMKTYSKLPKTTMIASSGAVNKTQSSSILQQSSSTIIPDQLKIKENHSIPHKQSDSAILCETDDKRDTISNHAEPITDNIPISDKILDHPIARTLFDWNVYLELEPAKIAPEEAFRRSVKPIVNYFLNGMKLEAKSNSKSDKWSVATVVEVVGLLIRLRYDWTDSSDDFYRLIYSSRIRPCRLESGEYLFQPQNYKGSLINYRKLVRELYSCKECRKMASNQDDAMSLLRKPYFTFCNSFHKFALRPMFPHRPKKPSLNHFEFGMKLEVRYTSRDCFFGPATVIDVNGDHIIVRFDGHDESYDKSMKFNSPNIFPINWCKTNGHHMEIPPGWDELLEDGKQLIDIKGILESRRKGKSNFDESQAKVHDDKLVPKKDNDNSEHVIIGKNLEVQQEADKILTQPRATRSTRKPKKLHDADLSPTKQAKKRELRRVTQLRHIKNIEDSNIIKIYNVCYSHNRTVAQCMIRLNSDEYKKVNFPIERILDDQYKELRNEYLKGCSFAERKTLVYKKEAKFVIGTNFIDEFNQYNKNTISYDDAMMKVAPLRMLRKFINPHWNHLDTTNLKSSNIPRTSLFLDKIIEGDSTRGMSWHPKNKKTRPIIRPRARVTRQTKTKLIGESQSTPLILQSVGLVARDSKQSKSRSK